MRTMRDIASLTMLYRKYVEQSFRQYQVLHVETEMEKNTFIVNKRFFSMKNSLMLIPKDT